MTRRLPLQSLTTLQPLTKSKCEMSDHDYITKIYLFSAFLHLTYEIKVHTAEEIKQVRDNLPKLGPLNKAMKIDEILISSDGDVKSKFLPLMSSLRVSKSKSPGGIEGSRLVKKATRMSKICFSTIKL